MEMTPQDDEKPVTQGVFRAELQVTQGMFRTELREAIEKALENFTRKILESTRGMVQQVHLAMTESFTKVDERFNRLENRMGGLESEMKQHRSEMTGRFDKFIADFEVLERIVRPFPKRLDRHARKLRGHEQRIGSIEARLPAD